MLSSEAGAPPPLEYSRVFAQTSLLLRRNALVFVLLGVLLVAVPLGLAETLTPNDAAAQSVAYWQRYATVNATSALGDWILSAAIVWIAAKGQGRFRDVWDGLAAVILRLPQVLLTGVIKYAAFVVGLVLLVVPGALAATVWMASVGALMVERRSVVGALRRSAELTRGNRWRLFGLYALYMLGSLVAQYLLRLLVYGAAVVGLIVPSTLYAAALIPGIATIVAVVSSALFAVVYLELRRLNSGAAPEAIAEVFD